MAPQAIVRSRWGPVDGWLIFEPVIELHAASIEVASLGSTAPLPPPSSTSKRSFSAELPRCCGLTAEPLALRRPFLVGSRGGAFGASAAADTAQTRGLPTPYHLRLLGAVGPFSG